MPERKPMSGRLPGSVRRRKLKSPTNSLVKVFRRALAEGVTPEGWLAGEGPRWLAEALKPGSAAVVQSVLLSQSAALSHRGLLAKIPRRSEVACVPDRLFQQVTRTQTPQGIAALVERPGFDLQEVLGRPNIILMVACGVQDPGNLGTMIRSADALGASAVLALRGTVSPFNPKAVRSCVGSIFRLPVFANLTPDELFKWLRASGIRTVAAERKGPVSVAEASLGGSLAILIGNEASGLSPELAQKANLRVSIPINPATDSLNAATAAGIILYEVARQRAFPYRHEPV